MDADRVDALDHSPASVVASPDFLVRKMMSTPHIEATDAMIPAEDSELYNDPFHFDWPFW